MSIPIKDISAGDTVSAMVDKINYNFDLLSLKGGGPAGIQGIQGIRGSIGTQGEQGSAGERGSRIYNFNPDPDEHPAANYNTGDMTLYGGVFYIVLNDGSENYWEPAMDINAYAESPFTNTETRSTVLRGEYIENQIVFGIENAAIDDAENANLEQRRNDLRAGSALVISGKHFDESDMKYHISMYGKNAETTSYSLDFADGNIYIDYEQTLPNTPILKLEGRNDGVVRMGCGNEYVQVGGGAIKLSTRRTMSSENNATFIVTTNINGEVSNEYGWMIDNNHSLFPYGGSHNIGKSSRRIGDIYVKQGSVVNFIDSNYGTDDFLKFSTRVGLSLTNVFALSSRGASFGINSQMSAYNFDQYSHFGIYIGNNNNDTKAPHITFVTNSAINSKVVAENIRVSPTTNNTQTAPNFAATAEFYLTNPDFYLEKHNMPLIKAKNESTAHTKSIGNTLCISGADYSDKIYGSGKDVVITGGMANNDVQTMESVGGTVFITGGIPTGVGITDQITHAKIFTSDINRMGNVIIGINPLHHKNIQKQSTYSADNEYEKLTSTNPEGVNFFDTNNVAIHANRIVIDSNANYRKGTYGNFTNDNKGNAFPYTATPNNSTLHISGINIIKHTSPVILDASQCCEYQLLSGTMTEVFQIKYTNGAFTVTRRTFNELNNIDKEDSLFFVVNQVWQKVGNVVNVNLRAEWYAYNKNDNELYYISDYMFGYNQWAASQQESEYTGYEPNPKIDPMLRTWYDYTQSGQYNVFTPYNKTLAKMMCNSNTSNEGYRCGNIDLMAIYHDIYKKIYDNWTDNENNMANQPITVFQIPISIESCYVSSICGNGNVDTEGVSGYYKLNDNGDYTKIDHSGTTCKSGNVIVGDFSLQSNADTPNGWSEFGVNLIEANSTGTNGVLHKSLGKRYSADMTDKNSKFNSNIPTDLRMNMQSNDFAWSEGKFIKTTTSATGSKYTYFYPQILTDFGNVEYYLNNQSTSTLNNKIRTPNRCFRPVIGLYTNMSLNYSYVITPNLDDKFYGMQYKTQIEEDFETQSEVIYIPINPK